MTATGLRTPHGQSPLADLAYGQTVMVTEAPAGVPATVLGRLTSPDLHTVAYVPSPERRKKAGVAADALEALGKDNDVRGKSRHSSEEAELLTLWLTAHRTRILIPVACQRVHRADLLDLVDMAQATPTSLLFAADHGFAVQLATALGPAAPTIVPWPTHAPELTSTAGRATGQDDVNWQHVEPVLPAVEYWTFYAAAKRQLATEAFKPVHDLYCESLERVTAWLEELRVRNADLSVGLAHGCLKALVEEQATFDDVTVVVRAAQAAFHQAGWFLDVDERELRSGLIRFNPANSSPSLYRRLRAYREPARAATVALYLAGATPVDIRDVTVDDLAQWHHNNNRPVAGRPVPDPATPYLRAALLARANDGAEPTSPAFPGDERRVNLDIRQASRDLDLNIGDANLNETSTINARRVPANVVKLERLS